MLTAPRSRTHPAPPAAKSAARSSNCVNAASLRRRGITRDAPPILLPLAHPKSGSPPCSRPIDAEGARVVWIMKSRPGAGLKRLWGLVSRARWTLRRLAHRAHPQGIAQERADLERRAGIALIDADWRLADFILSDAYRRTPEVAARRGAQLLRDAHRIDRAVTAGRICSIRCMLNSLPTSPRSRPAELMKEPEVAAWTIDPDTVKPYADEDRRVCATA